MIFARPYVVPVRRTSFGALQLTGMTVEVQTVTQQVPQHDQRGDMKGSSQMSSSELMLRSGPDPNAARPRNSSGSQRMGTEGMQTHEPERRLSTSSGLEFGSCASRSSSSELVPCLPQQPVFRNPAWPMHTPISRQRPIQLVSSMHSSSCKPTHYTSARLVYLQDS